MTTGATQGIFTTIGALAHAGDEVIVFEPAYDSYIPAIRLAGATPVPLPLTVPGYDIDWAAVRRAITPRTRMILVNTPNNPGTGILSADDLRQFADVTRGTDIVIVSDEVYEHMVYDGARHESLARNDELAARSVVIGSFGKTFHATGWKVGYTLAPPRDHRGNPPRAPVHRVHRQQRRAAWARRVPRASRRATRRCPHSSPPSATCSATALADTPFDLLPCRGSYFQLATYGRISDEPAAEFAQRLVRECGVATIPLSAFYQDGTDHRVIRFCFAKRDETILGGGGAAAHVCNRVLPGGPRALDRKADSPYNGQSGTLLPHAPLRHCSPSCRSCCCSCSRKRRCTRSRTWAAARAFAGDGVRRAARGRRLRRMRAAGRGNPRRSAATSCNRRLRAGRRNLHRAAFASRAADFPAFFSSRAPPVLL